MNRMGRTRKKRSKRRSHQTLRTRGGDLLAEFHRIISLRETAQQKVDASQNINRRFLKSLKGGTINIKRAKPIVNNIAKQRTELTSNFPFSIQPFWKTSNSNEERVLREAVERLVAEPSETAANQQRIVEIKQLFTTLSNSRLQAAKEVNQKWKNITRRASRASQMKMVNALRGISIPDDEKEENKVAQDEKKSLEFFDQFGTNLEQYIWTEHPMGLKLVDFTLSYVEDRISKTVVIIPTLDTKYYSFKYMDIRNMNAMKQWVIYSLKLIRMIKVMKTEPNPSKRLDSILRNTYHLTRIIAFLMYIKEGNKLPNTTFDMNTYETRLYRYVFYRISYMAYRDGNMNKDMMTRIQVSIQQLKTMFKQKNETQWEDDLKQYGITIDVNASARK